MPSARAAIKPQKVGEKLTPITFIQLFAPVVDRLRSVFKEAVNLPAPYLNKFLKIVARNWALFRVEDRDMHSHMRYVWTY